MFERLKIVFCVKEAKGSGEGKLGVLYHNLWTEQLWASFWRHAQNLTLTTNSYTAKNPSFELLHTFTVLENANHIGMKVYHYIELYIWVSMILSESLLTVWKKINAAHTLCGCKLNAGWPSQNLAPYVGCKSNFISQAILFFSSCQINILHFILYPFMIKFKPLNQTIIGWQFNLFEWRHLYLQTYLLIQTASFIKKMLWTNQFRRCFFTDLRFSCQATETDWGNICWKISIFWGVWKNIFNYFFIHKFFHTMEMMQKSIFLQLNKVFSSENLLLGQPACPF